MITRFESHTIFSLIVLLLVFKLVGIVPNPPRDFHAIGSQNATKIKPPLSIYKRRFVKRSISQARS